MNTYSQTRTKYPATVRILPNSLILFLLMFTIALLPLQVSGAAGVSGIENDGRILSPAEFLGYEPGDRFTFHHRAVAYFEHVATRSGRVKLQSYGETYEGRPLLVAYVSSEANMARLDDIRKNNLRRAGLLPGVPEEDGIAIVWLSYNIHGNESVSMDASLLTLFELADPENERTRPWLDNVVVVIDPALNPDGRDRYANWYNQMVGRTFNPDPVSREHFEPWPNGRSNHYNFDLNRDWAWQTQQESRLRNKIYQQWLPHVHADFHEMGGNRYYFAPAAEPLHEVITPWQREFQKRVGQNHAAHFDRYHLLYYTREFFDLFYPSYGDTWPTYQGAIGMTYEQSGSGRAGLGIITEEGDTLTLRRRIANQHLVGLSTVETSAREHRRLGAEFKAFYDRSRTNPPLKYKTIILRNDGRDDNLRGLLSLLDAHQIEYGRAPSRRNLRAFNYQTGTDETVTITSGDIVVSMHQPKSILAHVLLEPRTTLIDSLTYDITAWSLPYAYGIRAYATTERLEPEGDAADIFLSVSVQGFPDDTYAWLFKWDSAEDARFLAALHRNEIRARIAGQPFQIGEQRFARGTIVVTRNGNEQLGEDFNARIVGLAAEYGRHPVPVTTGLATSGIDLGSESVRFARAPRVLTFAGQGVQSLSFGEIWHFFDEQIGYPLTVVELDRAGRIEVSDFDVIILPRGNYGDLLANAPLERLTGWLNRGGRLILMDNVASQFTGKRGFDELVMKKIEQPEPEGDDRLRRFGDQRRERLTQSIAGAIYRVNVDTSHPLGFGLAETYYSLKTTTSVGEYMKRGWNVGHIPSGGHISGFVGYKVKPHLDESLSFGVLPVGQGQVVVFNDNPLFRGFWYNGRLLFSNAVFQPM